MHKLLSTGLLALAVGLASATAPFAAPTLKPQVDVAAGIVTLGDMFADAGDLGGTPLFLAPSPGTAGIVPIAAVRAAAAKAGLATFDDQGATGVRVARLATIVDETRLGALLSDELKARGILVDGMTASVLFDTPIGSLTAAAVAVPVQLANLTYMPSGAFTARFNLAGRDQPLDVSGRLELMIPVPELAATLAAGTILKPSDIQMQPVPFKAVENGNIATMEQLIGKQLQRQSRAGMVLKVSDVADPQIVGRNDLVTIYLHSGPLTLTAKGTALNAASLGQPVAVLNSTSKKIVHGIARADGAVEVTTAPVSVAGL